MLRPSRRPAMSAIAGSLAAALMALPAAAARFECAAPGVSLAVDVDPPAGTCAIDGQRVSLRKAHDPVVCHISTPQLRILTIRPDGAFTYEDTSAREVLRGTCSRG